MTAFVASSVTTKSASRCASGGTCHSSSTAAAQCRAALGVASLQAKPFAADVTTLRYPTRLIATPDVESRRRRSSARVEPSVVPVRDRVVLPAIGEVLVERGGEDVVLEGRRGASSGGDAIDVARVEAAGQGPGRDPQVRRLPMGATHAVAERLGVVEGRAHGPMLGAPFRSVASSTM